MSLCLRNKISLAQTDSFSFCETMSYNRFSRSNPFFQLLWFLDSRGTNSIDPPQMSITLAEMVSLQNPAPKATPQAHTCKTSTS